MFTPDSNLVQGEISRHHREKQQTSSSSLPLSLISSSSSLGNTSCCFSLASPSCLTLPSDRATSFANNFVSKTKSKSKITANTFPSEPSSPFSSQSSDNQSLSSFCGSTSCCSSFCGCSGHHEEDPKSYWEVSLDKDLVQTIIDYYPEWFLLAEDGLTRITTNIMEDKTATTTIPSPGCLGSPRAVVDEASIQSAMDKIKESLKVKLLLRRPISQLVEQGILPRESLNHPLYYTSQTFFTRSSHSLWLLPNICDITTHSALKIFQNTH